jgi:hypothetical protein
VGIGQTGRIKYLKVMNEKLQTTEQIFEELMAIYNEQVKQGYEWFNGQWKHPNEPYMIIFDSLPMLLPNSKSMVNANIILECVRKLNKKED